MKTGRYIIIKPSYWSAEGAKVIVITTIDELLGEVYYFYESSPEKNPAIRNRSIEDFEYIELIPASSLILELL